MEPSKIKKIITCRVCLETFNEDSKCPRMLSCGHSFCHLCLDWLLVQSPNCPTCKAAIYFTTSESIPINFSLQSLLNINGNISLPNTPKYMDIIELDPEINGSLASIDEPKAKKRKYKLEGYCTEHKIKRELRCMDCNVWICSICEVLYSQHKNCSTPVVAEAHKELEKKKLFKKVEMELSKRKNIEESFTEAIKALNIERLSLVLEVIRKESELNCHELRISELELAKAEDLELCDKLKRLQDVVENSATDKEFFKAKIKLDKCLEKIKGQIKNGDLYLPPTLAALETMCQNGSVYVMEDRYEGIRFGKVAVKDGRILVNSFQLEKPADATLFKFKDLLSKFNGSSELPKKVFFLLTPDADEDVFEVIIETDGLSPRAKNFILLCSGLKGPTYKGLEMCDFSSCYVILYCPPPVVKDIRDDDCRTPMKAAGVYGMMEENSWFRIPWKDIPSYSSIKFGDVILGLQSLKDSREMDRTVTECGLVI